jgi:hypothetical protein
MLQIGLNRCFRSHLKDHPIQSPLTTRKGMWRIYSNMDPTIPILITRCAFRQCFFSDAKAEEKIGNSKCYELMTVKILNVQTENMLSSLILRIPCLSWEFAWEYSKVLWHLGQMRISTNYVSSVKPQTPPPPHRKSEGCDCKDPKKPKQSTMKWSPILPRTELCICKIYFFPNS